MGSHGSRSVLLIGNFPPPFGGIPTHLSYLAPYLTMRGWTVDILSPKPSPDKSETLDGFRVHRPPHVERFTKLVILIRNIGKVILHFRCFLADPRQFLRYLQLFSISRQIVMERGTATIGSYHVFPGGLVGLWLKKEFGLRLVTTIFGEMFLDPDFHRKRLPEVKAVLSGSDVLLSCSQHCADSPRVLGLSHRAKVLYYGIDLSRFSPSSNSIHSRKKFRLPISGFSIMYLARMEAEMGLQVFLEAAPALLAELPDASIVVAGRSGPLRKNAESLSRARPNNVVVLADIPPEDLHDLYAASTIVVIPSVNERACLGLAIIEAMACGKPVVVTRMGGGPEVVFDGKHGLLIPPNDPKALVQAVLSLTSNPNLMENMGREGRSRVESFFDKEKTNAGMETYLSGSAL